MADPLGGLFSCIIVFKDMAHKADSRLRWVFGHSRARGNEEADAKACVAPIVLPKVDTTPKMITQSYVCRLMLHRRKALINNWWCMSYLPRYQILNLHMWLRKPPELWLPQRQLHKLITTRSNHWNSAVIKPLIQRFWCKHQLLLKAGNSNFSLYESSEYLWLLKLSSFNFMALMN